MKINDPNKKSWVSNVLFFILFISGLVIGFLAALFLPKPITGKFYELVICSVMLILWGFCGMVVIDRRELPQLIPIKGKLAIMYGFFIMVIFWGLALIFLVMAISKIV